MARPIDPKSPVPLYHQIAEEIRARIERGELRTGDALEPMRQAAEQWGVNLHTVRHAYTALAREGLLEMRSARGTRVTELARGLRGAAVQSRSEGRDGGHATEDVEAFLARTVHEAAERHNLGPEDLSARIAALGQRRRDVAIVECSSWQCEAHAAEITARWDVDAQAWPITRETAPAHGVVIATYFHYNDIRRRWPELLDEVRFLTIRVDPALEGWLGGSEAPVVLVERDEPTAQAVAADLRTAFGPRGEVRLFVTDDPATVAERADGARVLYSPRVWSTLGLEVRDDERCAVVRYVLDETELGEAAHLYGWTPRTDRPESNP